MRERRSTDEILSLAATTEQSKTSSREKREEERQLSKNLVRDVFKVVRMN